MLIKNWSYSYTGNPWACTRKLAKDIMSKLPLGEWPDSYKQEFQKRLQFEIDTVIDWKDVTDGVKENLMEHICFEPIE